MAARKKPAAPATPEHSSFQQEVWHTLSRIDCSAHIQSISHGSYSLSYLSWAWAWGYLMEFYPESSYHWPATLWHPGGSAEVTTILTMRRSVLCEGEQTFDRVMTLPVMDQKNRAIANPDSRQISDAKMRCLVKAMALVGLGHYIYAGEDLPMNDGAQSLPPQQVVAMLDKQAETQEPVMPAPVPVPEPAPEPEQATSPDFIDVEPPPHMTPAELAAIGDHKCFVDGCEQLVLKMMGSRADLLAIWNGNLPRIETIKAEAPTEYERLAAVFKARQQAIKDGEAS